MGGAKFWVAGGGSLGVKLGESGVEIFRRRVVLDGEAIFLDGAGRELGASVNGDQLFVDVRERMRALLEK